MTSVDEFVNSSAWLMKVSGAQRGHERHAASAADAHGGRLAATPRPPPPPFPATAMDDVPRHRPMAFDKMESLIKEMQDPETGVPVRSQKLFLTTIPSAFMGKGVKWQDGWWQRATAPAASGYDLVEWLMERFNLDDTTNAEAINLGNQLCQYGYFFPVNDLKNLILKDDSSLYRFQSPYYWPWHGPRAGGSAPSLGPDNVEYAIYLVKRTLRNKQRHGLEEYEQEALTNLKKNLAAKWDFITMQAEEQVRLAKERKKGDKVVSDSQERAYWRVARPPPGVFSALETCPVPVRTRQPRSKKKAIEQVQKEIEYLKASLDRTRVKTSIALEALTAYAETFTPYDSWLTAPQPSNPWLSDDTLYWQINSPLVEVPSEKRVQRWALSIEELISDPTGLQEFTSFLRKEYSHENIRFWLAVMDLRRSSAKQIPNKLKEIYDEFLKPGAPCEINIDGATSEKVTEGLRTGSRYALDEAAEHVYGLLLKKDCYPRFVRSDHFQRLLTEGKNVHQKKAKFFNFGGGQVKKKPASAAGGSSTASSGLTRRRGSDRSLSGSAHELAVSCARAPDPPPHSHSQTNLAELHVGDDDAVPWDAAQPPPRRRQDSTADSGSSSSDVSSAVERRRLPQQSTLDGGLRGAPPPLRRLSAVEPRHLAPLASPPRSPRVPRPPPQPAPLAHHPTPTISVSSAPDDDDGSLEDRPSLAVSVSDDSPSVFTSADVTPTDAGCHLPADRPQDSRSCSEDDADSVRRVPPAVTPPPLVVTEATAAALAVTVTVTGEHLQPAVVVTSPSTIVEVVPAPVYASTSAKAKATTIIEEEFPVIASTSNVSIAVKSKSEPISRPEQANVSATKDQKGASSRAPNERVVLSEVVKVKGELTRAQSEQTRGGSCLRRAGSEPCRAVAPLAEGEDCADDDAPSSPPPPRPIATTATPAPAPVLALMPTPVLAVTPAPAPALAATPAPAPAPAPASLSAAPTPPRSPRSPAHRDRKRNDVCPWEDE